MKSVLPNDPELNLSLLMTVGEFRYLFLPALRSLIQNISRRNSGTHLGEKRCIGHRRDQK